MTLKSKIIEDHKEKAITSTTACLAFLVLDADTPARQMAEDLDIPLGTPSSIKSRFNQNTYEQPLNITLDYLSKLENSKPQLSDEAKLIDSWNVPPQVETKKEFSAPMAEPEKKSYEVALEKKKTKDKQQEKEVDPQYYKLIDHLNKFGLYEKIKDYAQDEKAVELLSVIVEFIEKNSNSSFRMPKIFTYTLKAIIDSNTIEETKHLNHYMNALAMFRDEVTMLESWVEDLDGKVLDMFKSGNAEAMSKLYDEHKSTIAQFNESKERYKTVREAVCKQTELVESILSAKIPTF